jgi:alpha-L-fucosidase
MIKGLENKILDVELLGTGEHLTHKVVGKISWSPVPGLVFIDVPQNARDEYITVLKIKLVKPLRLYRGRGGLN